MSTRIQRIAVFNDTINWINTDADLTAAVSYTLVDVATKKKTAEEAAKEFVEDNGQAIKEYIKAFSVTFIQDIREEAEKFPLFNHFCGFVR